MSKTSEIIAIEIQKQKREENILVRQEFLKCCENGSGCFKDCYSLLSTKEKNKRRSEFLNNDNFGGFMPLFCKISEQIIYVKSVNQPIESKNIDNVTVMLNGRKVTTRAWKDNLKTIRPKYKEALLNLKAAKTKEEINKATLNLNEIINEIKHAVNQNQKSI